MPGVSLFDVHAALELARGAGTELPPQRAPPPPPPPVVLFGRPFRLLPDLSPGRAMLWGAVLSAWAVGGLCLGTARRLRIATPDDARQRLGEAMAPAAARVAALAAPVAARLRGEAGGAEGGRQGGGARLAAALRAKMQPGAA